MPHKAYAEARRRAQLVDDSDLFPKPLRELAFWRAGYACERCDSTTALGTFARRDPSPTPGFTSPSNCVVLCSVCALWMRTDIQAGREEGWLLPRHADPAIEPVAIVHRGPRLITPVGYRSPLQIAQPAA